MPSSTDGASAPEPPAPRDIRDRWAFRVVALLAVLVVAGVATRSCASSGDVSKDEAVAIAVEQVDFQPECYQVRFFRAGLQSTPLWAVSVWSLNKAGGFERIAVVQVNARTGDVVGIDESRRSPHTTPQCNAPL